MAFGTIFAACVALNLIAGFVNHIDDTDEVYGYWEPLHYLLFGNGMQTWEYAPQYALRTYAFIVPILVGTFPMSLVVPRHIIFQCIRVLLASFTAYCESRFVASINAYFGWNEAFMTLVLMLLSPGIFFSSTSYLPSAVAMNFVMLSYSSWLYGQFIGTILFGSIAVLWSGWPFVGVLFLPVGLSMVISIFSTDARAMICGFQGGFSGFLRLAMLGLMVVVFTALPAAIIDFQFYRKSTSPTINITLYNAIGSGDELYGIEPASYYIRNLLLNMGLSWMLVLLSPFILASEGLIARTIPKPNKESSDSNTTIDRSTSSFTVWFRKWFLPCPSPSHICLWKVHLWLPAGMYNQSRY